MPYKDPAKRAEYQRNYEAKMRAASGPKAEARRARRRAWWRAWHAKKYAEDAEFRTYRQATCREAQRRGRLAASRARSVEAMVAKAEALAKAAVAARREMEAKGYAGRLNLERR